MNDTPRWSIARFLNPGGGTHPVASGSRRHRPDYWILILASLLLVVGLVVVYSISPGLAASQHVSQSHFVTKQLLDVTLGLAAFALAAYLPYSWWWRMAVPLAVFAIIGAVIVMFVPTDVIYPAHRWIRIGGFSFQVAELVKLALLVWTARFLTAQWQAGQLSDFKSTLRPLLVVLGAVGLVVSRFESDLGSAVVMIAIVVLMAWVVGIPMKRVLIIIGLVLILLTLAISTSAYRRERLSTFLHPETSCSDSGYQACQALVSVGSGGLFGLGLGYSVQAYGYLPEASNDSIFAILAEKFGFTGTMAIVVIYGVIIARLKRIIEHSADQFSRLLVVGVLVWVSTQMIINAGAMLGLLPLKGITLPLISQGGTSLVFLAAALGMVFSISRYTSYSKDEPKISANQTTNNYSSNRRRVGRAHNPAVVARPRA